MPTFLNPWWALAAAAVVIPALLILYFLKLRRREMEVSSTLLWKKAIQDLQVNAPFQRLRRNLLLILQLLLLALLLLALARPVMNYTPGAGDTSVLLIDRSASMAAIEPDGRSRLEHAKQRARSFVDTMDRGATAMVIAFDDFAYPVQTFTTDTVALRRAIDSIEPTHRHTALKTAYQLAEAQITFIPEQNRPNQPLPDVIVYSDGRVRDGDELSIQGNLKYEKIGSDRVGNIAVVSLSAKRNYERPTEVQVFARLANFGPEPVTAQVQLSVATIDPADPSAAEQWSVRSVVGTSLLPDRWSEEQRREAEAQGAVHRDAVEFTLDLTTAAVMRVEQMNKENDALAADDVAQVVVPPPKPLAVLLVTDGNWFTEQLISVMNLKTANIITPASYEAKLPQDYDVIIFDRGYFPKQLPPAGNFIYFGSVGPDSKVKATRQEGGTAPIMLEENAVLDWQRDHPIMRGLVALGSERTGIFQSLQLEVPLEAERLMEGYEGPLIVLHRDSSRLHLVLAFDPLNSLWPTRPTFPYFMYNALQFMATAGDLTIRQSLEPGATPRIPRANLERAGEQLQAIRLIGPDGAREVPIPPAGDFALPALERVGIYRTDPVIPQYERIAVNLLSDSESNLVPVDHAPGYQTITAAASGDGAARLDLWWWIIACAALPLLLIEWWVYTRRVHL